MTDNQISPQIQAVRQIQEMIKNKNEFSPLQLVALKQAINALYYQAEIFNATQKSIDYAQKYVHASAPSAKEKKSHRGAEWGEMEEKTLVDMWTNNETLGSIAESLDRSELACFMRLEKLKVIDLTEEERFGCLVLLKNKQKIQKNEKDNWIQKAAQFNTVNQEMNLPKEHQDEIPSFGEASIESALPRMKM